MNNLKDLKAKIEKIIYFNKESYKFTLNNYLNVNKVIDQLISLFEAEKKEAVLEVIGEDEPIKNVLLSNNARNDEINSEWHKILHFRNDFRAELRKRLAHLLPKETKDNGENK